MIIAIDGPAGAGKSTVCRILAQRLCFVYLDTGAMYRAIAWALLQDNSDLPEKDIAWHLPRLPLSFFIQDGRLVILYRDKELGGEIRNPVISDQASRVSRLEPVRNFLLTWQRKLAEQGNIVAEGRDTGTVVFPEAELKVFLTADLSTRIERRRLEYVSKGIDVPFEEMEKRIRERDDVDSNRTLAPLKPADDAVMLDTSRLDIAEVVEMLERMAGNRRTEM